jgi:hypothetical protein
MNSKGDTLTLCSLYILWSIVCLVFCYWIYIAYKFLPPPPPFYDK